MGVINSGAVPMTKLVWLVACVFLISCVGLFSEQFDIFYSSVGPHRTPASAVPALSVSSTLLQNSGDTVTLSWSGIPAPGQLDWIALWSADKSTLFAWFYAYEQLSYHRKQAKWPVLYPHGGARSLRAPGTLRPPAPVEEVLEFHSNMSTGTGSATFRLYNMRLPGYVFMYYNDSAPEPSDAPMLASPTVQFALSIDEPTHPRLALTNVPNQMRVMWTSGRPDSFGTPTVLFGPSPNNLLYSANGTSHTFNITSLCHAPIVDWGWIDPGYIHDVAVNPVAASGGMLSPGSTVYYTMGANGIFSKNINWFVVPTTPGMNASADFVWIMYADMGTETEFGCLQCRIQMKGSRGAGVSAVVNAVTQREVFSSTPPAFIAHVGDISYARNMAWKWDIFFETVAPLSSRIPYMIENGNHEYDHQAGGTGKDPSGDFGDAGYRPSWGNYGRDSHGECGVHLYQRFHMPDNGNTVFWYAFGSNNLWMITLSTEHSLEIGSPQRNWFELQLSSVNRAQFPWLVVAIHRPLYTSEYEPGGSDYNVSIALQGIIGGLLQQWSVDLVVAGHYHSYERGDDSVCVQLAESTGAAAPSRFGELPVGTCPVFNHTCLEDTNGAGATMHAIVGTAGIGFDSPVWMPAVWSKSRYASIFAYARVHVQGANDLHWQLIDANTGVVMDDVHIHSNHSFVFPSA